jgi:hypothetical protein
MKHPSIVQLLHDDFRFLIDDAGFAVSDLDVNHAMLKRDDLSIALRWDAKDDCFCVVLFREDCLHRFYPLVDYLDYFDNRHTRHVREIPSAHEQATRLRIYLPQIASMLRAENDCPEWREFDLFHQLKRS